MLTTDLFLAGFDAFLFVLVRMTGLFVIAPIFGRASIPGYFKVGFSLMMSVIIVNTISLPTPGYDNSIYQVALIIIKEFVVGVSIGFISYLIFTAIYIAGEVMDMQIGFGISNVIDPISNIQVPMTSNLYYMMAMLVFLAMNGHHWLIKAIYDSYTTVPLGTAAFNPVILNNIMSIMGSIFFIGFKIAAPVIAA
ncbi:MAG: flagellar biosynthetic protein FliR, partial [Clostridiales bacterium]|nr:flagellar biosynthetic protein FliR [Clostridiales bacterium]